MQIQVNRIWKQYSNPEITVLTPIYNRKATIKRALKSVEKQTYRNFEYILVDDGSTEDCDDIIEEFMARVSFPVMYIKKPNGGVHTARNVAWQNARGKYSIGLDSDDELLDNGLEIMINTWKKIEDNSEYREVVALCIDQNGHQIGASFPSDINEKSWKEAVVLCDNTQGEHVACYRTEIMKENPWPEPEGITFVTEDIVWKSLEKKYKSYFINDLVRIYHMDTEESYSNSKKSLQKCRNIQWNIGYMLNHWNIYKSAKYNKIQLLLQFSVFTRILKVCNIPVYNLDDLINRFFIAAISPVTMLVARTYIKKKMEI